MVGYREPNYRFAITNTLSYKGFSLSVMFNSIQGGNGYFLGENAENINPRYYMPQRMNNSLINAYWRPDAPTQNTTGIYNNPPRQSGIYQSRSFVRLQDVSLSYSLSPSVLKTVGLANCSFYVSAKNPYVWTKWQGWDPEVYGWNASGQAVDNAVTDTPLMRNFVGGVRFSF